VNHKYIPVQNSINRRLTEIGNLFVCLFSWRYNPLCLYFHSPVAGFNLFTFEISWSHTTTHNSL